MDTTEQIADRRQEINGSGGGECVPEQRLRLGHMAGDTAIIVRYDNYRSIRSHR
ncbi:MAG: hypothetical protein U9N46_04285 [Euryarchaeota archaeon]|nr:hypothetical protein [Euryarchaeota archaeon]